MISNITRYLLLNIIFIFGIVSCQHSEEVSTQSLPTLKVIAEELTSTYQAPSFPESIDTAALIVDNQLWVSNAGTLYFSPNGGVEWEIKQLPNKNTYAVALQSTNDGKAISVISQSGERFISNDLGNTWHTTDFSEQLEIFIDEAYIDSEVLVDKAYISSDGNNIVLVFQCEVVASFDSGLTWKRSIDKSALPKPGQYFYCAEDIILDENFKPSFAQMHMTGSIRSGTYVLANQADQWYELCSTDYALVALDVAPDCEDQQNAPQLSRFIDSSALLQWLLLEDRLDFIFQSHHLPLPTNLSFDGSFEILSTQDDKHWFFSNRGIAFTTNKGQTWRTLTGGAGELSSTSQLSSSYWLGINQGKLYQSADNIIWEKLDQNEDIWQLVSTSRGALASTNNILLYESPDQQPLTVLTLNADDIITFDDLVWVISDAAIAVSTDGGLNWQQHANTTDYNLWSCAKICLGIDGLGHIKKAALINNILQVEKINQVDINGYYSFERLWNIESSYVWVLESYIEEDDFPRYSFTIDFGNNLLPLNLNKEYVLDVFYQSNNTAFIITEHGLHTLDTQSGAVEYYFLSDEVTISEACISNTGLIIAQAYIEEEDMVFYKSPNNKNWHTESDERLWCDV